MEDPSPQLRHLPLGVRDITHILTQAKAPVNGGGPTTKRVPALLSVMDDRRKDAVPSAKDMTAPTRKGPSGRNSCSSAPVPGTCSIPECRRLIYTPHSPCRGHDEPFCGWGVTHDHAKEVRFTRLPIWALLVYLIVRTVPLG